MTRVVPFPISWSHLSDHLGLTFAYVELPIFDGNECVVTLRGLLSLHSLRPPYPIEARAPRTFVPTVISGCSPKIEMRVKRIERSGSTVVLTPIENVQMDDLWSGYPGRRLAFDEFVYRAEELGWRAELPAEEVPLVERCAQAIKQFAFG